jgi:hypothetical protein
MATAAVRPSQTTEWKNLYVAALLEGDVDRIPALIADAERAIITRARELFSATGDNIQEEEALDDALYALHALKSCIQIHGRFAEAA